MFSRKLFILMYRIRGKRFQGRRAASEKCNDRRQHALALGEGRPPILPRLAVALVLGAVGGLTTLVAPWCLGQIVNRVIAAKHPDVHVLYVMLLAIFGALMLGAVATYGQTYLMAWSGQHLIAKMRALLFERVLRLPLGEFAKWRPGELISRFSSDLQIMTDAVTTSLPQLLTNSVTFVASFTAMVSFDWLLTCSLIVVAPIISLAVSRFQRLISNSTLRSQQRIADLLSTLTEALTVSASSRHSGGKISSRSASGGATKSTLVPT